MAMQLHQVVYWEKDVASFTHLQFLFK